MKKELIVDEHGDLMLFASDHDVCEYLEAIDVKNNEYIVYSVDGELMELKIVAKVKKWIFFSFHQEQIVVNETGKMCSEELIEKVKKFLLLIGVDSSSLIDKELPDLINVLRVKQAG